MEENKNINEELYDIVPIEDIDEVSSADTGDSGLSTPLAMLIGAGIALGVSAVSKRAVKWYKDRKAAKAVSGEKAEEPPEVFEGEIVTEGAE